MPFCMEFIYYNQSQGLLIFVPSWVFCKGAFKYYVIKEVGGWGQKMAILDDLQYCKSSKSWVGGPKKVKNMMT